MDARLSPDEFRRFVATNAAIEEAPRGQRYSRILAIATERLIDGPRAVVAALPAAIADAMQDAGWEWNGFYAPGPDGALHVGPAHGPPVCTPLTRQGGLFESGMCFACLDTNQTLAASDVRRWPGYVSCDSESGLRTLASIVCPVRSPAGTPVAVWDLDAVAAIEPQDIRFCDVLFATLARAAFFESEHFRP